MNDHDAMEAINAVLEMHYRGEISPAAALQQISLVCGWNAIEHAKAKEES